MNRGENKNGPDTERGPAVLSDLPTSYASFRVKPLKARRNTEHSSSTVKVFGREVKSTTIWGSVSLPSSPPQLVDDPSIRWRMEGEEGSSATRSRAFLYHYQARTMYGTK